MDERRHLLGTAALHRVGLWEFPVYELRQAGEVMARLGRFGWLRIFLGSGQQIEFPDGQGWRVRSVGVAANICPLVVDGTGRKVAASGLGIGSYGINGKDYACGLYPAEEPRLGRANRWTLRHHEVDLATVTRRPLAIDAVHPVPLGAVFLCLVLVRYGIPGESAPRLPAFRWG